MAGHNEPDAESAKIQVRRVATGVPGLDTILMGGLLNRATHLLVGASGTGKTVLSQQIAYNRARFGETVLYLTLLSESHEKLINNLGGFTFFEPGYVGSKVNYFSLYHEISGNGIGKLTTLCRDLILKYKSRLVVIDGISALRDFSQSPGELRKVLFDLNAQLSNLNCTVLLLVDDEYSPHYLPEIAIADSIIRLHNAGYEMRHVRSLEIVKMRGAATLNGFHYFEITPDGLLLYPRTEAVLHEQIKDPPPAPKLPRRSFGISGLDAMIGGGLLTGSINILLGTPGGGKSLTGLRFIYEGARQGEKCLILSFHQSADHVRAKSKLMGFDITPYMDSGMVSVMWVLPVERYLDEVTGRLLQMIAEIQPSRLFIDALSDLEVMSLQKERLQAYWAALTNYLRNQQITTLGSLELNRIAGNNLDVPERPISIIADSIILLRSVELDGHLKHLISVLEMRDSNYDNRVCEYLISSDGLQVGEPFTNVGTLLSGMAGPTPKP